MELVTVVFEDHRDYCLESWANLQSGVMFSRDDTASLVFYWNETVNSGESRLSITVMKENNLPTISSVRNSFDYDIFE